MQSALDILWSYSGEFFEENPLEEEMKDMGIGGDLEEIRGEYDLMLKQVLQESGLALPAGPRNQRGGKSGVHSEHFGFILSNLQYMQRTYPEMSW